MNNCTLALKISQAPQIRYTPNSQIVGEVVGEFYSPHHHEKERPSPASTFKVIAWGEHLAEQLNAVEVGGLYVVCGRLSMMTTERPEGFKEKQAELIAERIFAV